MHFSKIKVYFFLLTISFSALLFGSETRTRYKNNFFPNLETKTNVIYRIIPNYEGTSDTLRFNIYMPLNDTLTIRPLVIVMHGGGFISGTKHDSYVVAFCKEMAHRGFITASIDYRLGLRLSLNIDSTKKEYGKTIYRATQDSRAAVRFFRVHASKFGIDTSNIFVAGMSAGAFTALNHAYMDQNEADELIETRGLGSLDNGDNLGYSSSIKAVINYCGAVVDTMIINSENIPVISFHGTSDTIVPYDIGPVYGIGFLPIIFGSAAIHRKLEYLGIKNSLVTFEGDIHMLSESSITKSYPLAANFLYKIINSRNTAFSSIS